MGQPGNCSPAGRREAAAGPASDRTLLKADRVRTNRPPRPDAGYCYANARAVQPWPCSPPASACAVPVWAPCPPTASLAW